MAWKQTAKKTLVLTLLLLLVPVSTWAAQSSSNHFQVNEVFFGSGGELNACSTGQYCSKQSAGELVVGNTSSNGYQAQGGFNTDRQPFIEMDVSNTNVDLGTLSTGFARATTATFTVKTYLAHGYVVVNASDPPTNNSYTMLPISTPSNSAVGTEQFGINLVANTSPTIGSNKFDTPNSTFGFGQVAANYGTANKFMYAKGGTDGIVAFSNRSSGFTTYTVSYLFNISSVTPGGTYTFHHVLVATSTF